MTTEQAIALLVAYGHAQIAHLDAMKAFSAAFEAANVGGSPEVERLRAVEIAACHRSADLSDKVRDAAYLLARFDARAPGAVEATRVLASEIAANDARSEMRVVGVTRSGAVVIGRRGGR